MSAHSPPPHEARSAERGPVLAALGATLLVWGFAFIPLKLLTSPRSTDHPLSPEGFLVLRFVPLLPLLLWMAARRARRERAEALRRDWPWILAMGLLVIPAYHLPMNHALRTPLHTGLISLLLNLSPALTYFLAVAFRQERASGRRTAGVLVAFGGLALIFGEELLRVRPADAAAVFSWKGVGWMLFPALAWTSYTLIARRLASGHDPQFLFAASEAVGTLAVLAAAPFIVSGKVIGEWRALTALDWGAMAYVSLLSSFLAYWVWIVALTRYEASRLASTGNLVPLLVHLAAAVFLPEERKAFTPIYLLGAAVTLAGTTLVVTRPPSRLRRDRPAPTEVDGR